MGRLGIIGVALTVVCAALFGAAYHAKGRSATSEVARCGTCHKGSAMQTHTADFVQRGHGIAASADRQSCLDCHETKTCDTCHQKEAPQWHGQICRGDVRGHNWLRDHIETGAARRNACFECHEKRFHKQCACCHLPTEWSS